MKCGLSSSPILAEAKDSKDSTVESEDPESSESETTSSFKIKWSSSIPDVSDPDPPSRSLFIADFAVSLNHSSSGSALVEHCDKVVSKIERFRNLFDKKRVAVPLLIHASGRECPNCTSYYS